MPKLTNSENDVVMEINLVKNEYIDVEIGRDDFENWIPFTFNFTVEEKEVYSYPEERGVSLSLYEIKRMISGFEAAIRDKCEGIELKNFDWGPIDNYFSMHLEESYEKDWILFKLWISVGELTQGKSYGYNKGFWFEVTTDSLKSFIEGIKEQFASLCG